MLGTDLLHFRTVGELVSVLQTLKQDAPICAIWDNCPWTILRVVMSTDGIVALDVDAMTLDGSALGVGPYAVVITPVVAQ